MSLSLALDFGTRVGPGSVRFERLRPGPSERVWAYLTEPEQRARWLAGGDLRLEVGGRVELRFRNADRSPLRAPTAARFAGTADGSSLRGTVTACAPMRSRPAP